MRFSVDWDDGDRDAVDVDLHAVGNLRIEVGGVDVCDNVDVGGDGAAESGRVSRDLPVSVCPLAEGISGMWWRLFGARGKQHRLIWRRGGYAIPDLRIRFDGDEVEVACPPYRYDNPPLSFPNAGTERIGRADAERALGGFLDAVCERLAARGVTSSCVGIQWASVQESRRNADEAAFCEAAGALGLDPYDIADADADLVMRSNDVFDGEPLREFLTGMGRAEAVREALDWVSTVESRPRDHSRIPALEGARETVDTNMPRADAETPWERGYRQARAFRRRLDMSSSARFRSVSGLAKRLDAPGFCSAPPIRGVSALVQSGGDTRIHLRRTGMPASRLFVFARAIGDAVANPPAGRSVVNDLHEASRQACGRAFAAEFLAPIDEIDSMSADGLDTDSIAAEFCVSPELVERQLDNAARIARACARA